MISIDEVKILHQTLIENFGGSQGVRDIGALKSALARPFQTFDNKELYNSVLEKAASLVESILVNHPFVDGNKRTGYTLLRLYLLQNGLDITASLENKYEFIINIASGTLQYEKILEWLQINVRETKS